jgi:leucyl aminopeptidase (aminopeptidase T)
MKPEKIVLEKCLGLRADERCLIVTDSTRIGLADRFYKEANRICETELLLLPVAIRDAVEPADICALEMQRHDVVVILTAKSLSHTKARKLASEKGARIASMPGITEDMMARCIDVDYRRLASETNRLALSMTNAKSARIMTESGTDLSFSIHGRAAHGMDAAIFTKKGAWGNLPEGEAYIAPVEGTACGTYVVDASQSGVGPIAAPIKITVKRGMASKISGGDEAKRFRRLLSSVKSPKAYNIAEFGIGTNPKARVTGIVLEDEKVLGTCHIALGNNFGFGGKVKVPIHTDGVIMSPTICLDGKEIMRDGRLLV